MIEKQIVVNLFKGTWSKIVFYCKTELLEQVKEIGLKALGELKKFLWNKIKEDVKTCAQEIIKDAEAFMTSVECKEKEERILDAIMAKIELPLLLKPFKKLIRSIIKGKIEAAAKAAIEKGKEIFSTEA